MSDNSNVVPENQDNIARNASAGETTTDNSKETVIESGDFKGKTIADVENMYSASQAMIAKQGNDIGTMRQDIEHLKQVTAVPLKTDEEIAELMSTDPATAVKEMQRKISNNMQESTKQTPGQIFLKENPVLSTPEFDKWANETGMAGMAGMAVDNLNNSGDPTAINSLINAYNKTINKDNVNAAMQASSPGTTAITPKSKVKFTLEEINKMSESERRSRDSEILAAYAAGEVK